MAVICGQVETGKADMWGNQTTVYEGEGGGETGREPGSDKSASVKYTSVENNGKV